MLNPRMKIIFEQIFSLESKSVCFHFVFIAAFVKRCFHDRDIANFLAYPKCAVEFKITGDKYGNDLNRQFYYVRKNENGKTVIYFKKDEIKTCKIVATGIDTRQVLKIYVKYPRQNQVLYYKSIYPTRYNEVYQNFLNRTERHRTFLNKIENYDQFFLGMMYFDEIHYIIMEEKLWNAYPIMHYTQFESKYIQNRLGLGKTIQERSEVFFKNVAKTVVSLSSMIGEKTKIFREWAKKVTSDEGRAGFERWLE